METTLRTMHYSCIVLRRNHDITYNTRMHVKEQGSLSISLRAVRPSSIENAVVRARRGRMNGDPVRRGLAAARRRIALTRGDDTVNGRIRALSARQVKIDGDSRWRFNAL